MKNLNPKRIANILALTPVQEGMLFHYLQDPHSELYFEQLSLEIYGAIDARHFEKAWNAVVETNEMLRVMFRWEEVENPVQLVLKKYKLQPRYTDLSGFAAGQRKERLEEIKRKDAAEKFNLNEVPFRVTLCKIEEDKYVIIISNHHILYDGWSTGVILKEFFLAYHEFLHNGRVFKFSAKPPFKEYIRWIQSQDRNKQEQFWREYLADFETPTELPIKRRIEETSHMEDYSIILAENLKSNLDAFVKNNRVTLASVFYTAWGILLQKYCGSEDVIFGTTVSGRSVDIKGIENMVGLFINTIPLRVQTAPGAKIIELISAVENLLRKREEFESTPPVDIRSYSQGNTDGSGSLFDTIMAIENYPLDNRLIPEDERNFLSVHSYSMKETTHYDLSVGIMPFNEIEIKFSFKGELFEKEAIESLARHFKGIIQTMVENRELGLTQLEIISTEEKKRVLYDFNNTATEYPVNKTIHQLFEEQATKRPDIVGLFGDVRHIGPVRQVNITYRQLNEQSDRLAGLLIEKGVLADNIVGIKVERSIEMVIGILGILKSGGAYLPIEPDYPQERIDYMLRDSGAQLLINEKFFGGGRGAILQKSPHVDANLAYVIYTSGSTGKPKGVMVGHAPVVNLLYAMQEEYPFTPADTYLLKTSFIFDVSVTELFGWYMGGGRLAILEKGGEKDPSVILDSIERNCVTHINFVPSMFNVFEEYLTGENTERISSLKYIFLAGEALLPGLVEKFRNLNTAIILENIYGPTEGTVYSSKYSLSEWVGSGSIPIGKPLPNIELYILNKSNYMQPIGVPGELCIAGGGLARGYLNRPELTSEKFGKYRSYRTNRTYSNYKTGDLARFLSDGNIEFLGRIDQQVKIRGFRLELGEIENRLLKHPDVKEAVVIVKTNETGATDSYLCAYIVSHLPQTVLSDRLREFLSLSLPDYMAPAYFVLLEKIPLTPSGKLDRRALPEPELPLEEKAVMPESQIEVKLADIWSTVLGIDQNKISIGSNFFRLGGHSLKITRLASAIYRELGFTTSLTQLFRLPTIRAQARYLQELEQQQKQPVEYIPLQPAPTQEYYDLSYAQRRLWVLCQFEEDSIAYNEVGGLSIKGKLNTTALDQAIQALAQRHESLRTVFAIVNGEPKQKINPQVELKLHQEDLRHLTGDRLKMTAAEIIKETANTAFNLEKGPLAMFKLLHLEDETYYLVVNIHHIVNDGWSVGVIKKELNALYDFFNKNKHLSAAETIPLPPLPFQYKDYTHWHNRLIADGYFEKFKEYWLEKFKDKPTGVELPLDHPRGSVQTFNGGRVFYRIEEKDVATLRQAQTFDQTGEDTTPFMRLMMLLTILLHKYSGEKDITIGSPIAGRRRAELYPMIGFLVNTLVYRVQVDPGESFKQLLLNMKQETLACYENQDYPFDILVENLGLARDLSRSPLFNVMLAFGSADTFGEDMHFDGTDVEFHSQVEGFNPSLFDLVFFIDERGERLDGEIMYNSDLFERSTIERMTANFLTLLKNVLANSDTPIFDLDYIEKGEYETIVNTFNCNRQDYPSLTIQELVEQQVEKSPDRVAVVSPEGWAISYDEINHRANRLSHYLRWKYGIGPGRIVGICIERSIEMIIAVLGVVKSGAGYLSFDPNYPKDRVQHMIQDSRTGLVIIDRSRPDLFDPGEVKESDQTLLDIHEHWPFISDEAFHNPKIVNELSDAVYVIYTSGSTGTPNGAMLSHALLSNLVQWQATNTGIDGSLRCLQFTSINFCVSFQEIFTTLSSGGEVHLIGDIERQDIDYLVEFLARRKIGNLYLPFSYLNFLFNLSNETEQWDKSHKTSLQHIITAGEQLKITGGLKKFLDQNPLVKLHNHYGSSEMHVVTSYTLEAADAAIMPVPPAGKPITNTRIYIQDEYERPVPIGVWGELFVDGSHQVLGYIHNPALTDKKLVWHPVFSPISGHRLYRSGDVGRWLEDGNIELKGRKDFQVKIRGFRVEPSEIESKILALEKVKDCVVVVKESTPGEKILVAYVVAHDLDVMEMKRQLGSYLPQYMIPKFMVLESLPLMPNGKVDRERLPELPAESTNLQSTDFEGLRFEDEIEEKVVGIWAELLGVDRGIIGRDDNFFELGGHSLKATTMMTRIHKEFNVRVKLIDIFKAPTVREVAALIARVSQERFAGIEPVEEKEYYVVSSAQERMYVLQQMDVESTVYNMSRVMVLEGDVDLERLEGAVNKLVERHEGLRTSFEIKDEKPVQVIHTKSFAELFQKRPLGESQSPGGGTLLRFIRPFDLSCAPLLRVGLEKLTESQYLLMVDMHHIISDGVSVEIMINDFIALYQGAELPAVRVQYKDYAEWQRREKQGESLLEQKDYWKKEFAGEVPVLELPFDYARPVVQSFEGKSIPFEMNKETFGALKTMALEAGATLYILLLALYTVLLSKLSSQEDIVIGSPVAGRRHADLEKIIGMFVNTLALRNYPSGEKKFSYFLEEVKEKTLKTFENQDYQYEDLVEELAIIRDAGRNPLFDAFFALQNAGRGVIEIPGLKIKPYELENLTAKFDLSLMVMEAEDKLLFEFEYSTKLLKKETVERFISYFENIVRGVIKNKEQKISDYEIIAEEEKKRILFNFNDTAAEYPVDKTIHQLFEEQASRTPDHIAIVGSAPHVCPASLTYRQFNEQSDRLAGFLIEKGVLPDNIVGIMMERSIEMVIGIFGILKAGGAYLPIDPDYPRERIDYMLADSKAKTLLTTEECEKEIIVNCQLLIINYKLEALPQAPLHHSSHLAYIIYTSGSTGKPKGVMVGHASVVNLLFAMQEEYHFTPADTYLLKTSFIFDVSVTELFGWYMGGGRLAILERGGEKDPRIILDSIERNCVSHINFVPSMFNVFEEYLTGENTERISSLKYIFLAGEALLPGLVERFRNLNTDIILENIYGPTESTVYCSKYSLSDWNGIGIIPIGRPLPNIKLYILNNYHYLQPVGIAGELCIAGVGLARGYLNRPELTADKFIKYRTNRAYRTYINYKSGDLARFLSDGNIEFLGRIDQQVKIRGFRVELGEIENRLTKIPGVKEAVVLTHEEDKGDKYLCAYIATESENVISELRKYLSMELPDYMIPSYFVPLDKIPLTPSGKVDRRALPVPETKKLGGYVEPRTKIERKLVELWSEILGRDVLHAAQLQTSIGIDDNFFQLGGHSLKATILIAKIHKAFDVKIPLAEIFKRPTIRAFSDYIKDAAGEKYRRIDPLEKKEYYPLSSAQKRLYFIQAMEETGTEYNMPQFLKLEGKVERERLEDTFVKLLQRHESLRTSFATVGDEPVQRIHENVEFEIEFKNLATDEHGQPRTFLTNFIRPFDLSKAPLMRVGLVKEDEERYLLMADMHHSITDGVSLGILVKEFLSLYRGELLPPLQLQYKDFSGWQNREMVEQKGESILRQEAYWLKEFESEAPVLDLPYDYPKPKVQGFEGRGEIFIVDNRDTQALELLAREQGATLYMVLLSIYNIFLARITHQETIVVGTSTAGRIHSDLEGIIGMFVNTLALKNEPAGEKTIGEFLSEVREKTLQAFANQEYQYEDLVKRTAAARDMGRNPLFDTMFVFQDLDIAAMEIPGLKVIPYEYERNTSKFDLTLECVETENRLRCMLEYSTKLFKRETIQRFIDYHRNIIAAVLENPYKRIVEIEILAEEEKTRLLRAFNDTAKECPDNKTIYQLFEDQVENVPDHIALVFKDKALTFRYFDEAANRMANYLRGEKRIREGDRVAVLMNRSIELIISLMGIMKSGGAYVPLDAAVPAERLRVVFNDASIGIAVSMQQYREKLTWLQSQCKILHSILCMDEADAAAAIDNYPATKPGIGYAGMPAYVMYTSGSSGIPKGVLVEHRTIVNTLGWRKDFYGYNPDSMSLQNPPYFFDSSVTDIFTPLLGGARLVLIEENERLDLAALKRIIFNYKVTHFIAVPVFYNVLLEEIGDELTSLKMVCAAGEYFPDELVKKHFKRLPWVRITNEYGPTENSVNTTVYEVTLDSTRAYIGKPIWNVAVYILDRYMQLCPIGVSGELCLSGSSLARGYLNRPELTAERFNRFYMTNKTYIFYKTGDMGRWLPDGNLEFIGRLDSQVKIRGIRIETGEIENHLLRHHSIREAVVLAREGAGGEKFLCAYIVPSSDGSHKPGIGDDLKEYLSAKLPDYMIPSYFIVIDAIPLMPNGKINRDALPPLPSTGLVRQGSQSFIAPRNESEEKLAGIWSDVLGIERERIGIDDDFFELGGYSLRATIVASRIHKIFNVKIPLAEIFISPTIRGLAKYIAGAGEQIYSAIEPTEKKEYYPLSAAQKRLYLLYRMDPANVSYNMPLEIRLQEEINLEILQGVFKKLIDRHESLRTSFEMVNEEPVQRVHDHVEFEIEISKAFGPTFFQKGGFIQPFDLSKAPLLRAVMMKEENGRQLLWVDIHHIITDGTSQVILHAEFDQLCRGQAADLPTLRIQYKDYSQWQNSEPQQALVIKKEPYWLREFGDELPVLNLPCDYARPFIQSFEGNTVEFSLNIEENRVLRRLAREANVTLFMMILAIFNVLLSKLSGQEDIIVGTPVRGRRHADLESIIGMFINTLPLRNKPYGGMKMKTFLNELKEQTLEAYENQEYPFEELVEKITVKRDTSRNPVFDVMFNLLNQEAYLGDTPVEAEIHEYQHKKGTSKFDLMLTAVDMGDKLLFIFEYCSMLFEPVTIERFIVYFKRLLYWLQVLPNPELSEMEIITEKEKQTILYEFNDTKVASPTDKTIHQLFAEQASKTPDRVGLVGDVGDVRPVGPVGLTYRQLNEQSDRLAGLLIGKGVLVDSIVGIMMGRTIDLVIGILGILKAGGAYLPVDSEYPDERKRYMIEDGEVRHLLVSNDIADIGPEIITRLEVIDMRQEAIYRKKNVNLGCIGSASSLLYVIYTSGTTGKPKGVMLEHRNLVNLILYQYEETNIDFSRVLQFTTISFDVSAQEIFSTFLWGGQLYLVSNETRTDIPRLFKLIGKNGIITVFLPISFLKAIFKEKEYINLIPRCIRHIVTAGEQVVISSNFKDYLRAEKVYLHNHYGPAEAHVVTTLTINPGGDIAELPPIGKPVMNTKIYIVDKWGCLLPPRIMGEIRIGGVQVGRGYLNRPELTGEKFIMIRSDLSDLSDSSDRFYKTGDLARWLDNNNIEFLGRIDQQVKIRGFRIELAEIENRLKEHPAVKEAVVIDRKDDERKYLCAYIVAGQTGEKDKFPLQQLKEYLETKLPSYMVPPFFVEIDKIPLKANGKIDRDRLPGPMESDFHGSAFQAPETDIQQTIAAIWEEVLGLEKIGIRDNFFDLGGNSLDFVRVSNKLKEKLGQDIPVVTLFTYPTISSLEQYLGSVELPITSSVIPENFVMLNGSPQAKGNIFLVHEVLGDVGAYMKFCKQLGTQYNCWGVEAEKLRNYVPRNTTIEEIAAKYISQMKEIQSQGPYLLATWSWGGHLGLEMALQLERAGEKLSLLAFFDCLGPDCARGRTSQVFTLETEKDALRDFFTTTGNEAELEKINNKEQLWSRAVDILTGSAVLVEKLRELLIENALALPDYDELTGEELIQYLNLNRTHFNASAKYIPSGKIHTPIHYFAANQNTERFDAWKDYCHTPIIYHEITGDHHSIFRNKEQIVEFARLFNEILGNTVRFEKKEDVK